MTTMTNTTQDTYKTIEIGVGKSSLAKEMITDLTQSTPDPQGIHNGDRYCLNCGLKQIKGKGFCTPCRYGGGSHRVVIKGAIKYFCRLIGSAETCTFDNIPDGYKLIEEIKY